MKLFKSQSPTLVLTANRCCHYQQFFKKQFIMFTFPVHSSSGLITVLRAYQSLFAAVSLSAAVYVPHRFVLSHFLSLQAMRTRVPRPLQVMGLKTKQVSPRIRVQSVPVIAHSGLLFLHCLHHPLVNWKSPCYQSVSMLTRPHSHNKAS